jgi:predicted Zn-dependent peptidase
MPQQRWRLAAAVAANLFGGGMSAPLVDTVRERMGLAYVTDASLESGDAWASFIVHAVTTPDKLDALATATGELLRAHAAQVDPVHLERAKNQLTVTRVREAERTYGTMERAVEELFARGAVTPAAEVLETIASITQEEVRAVFERMLRQPPALAITGKGATGARAKQLRGTLAGALGH